MLFLFIVVFFFKQKTAYEMRISDWSSDVCSSDLHWAYAAGARRLSCLICIFSSEDDIRAAVSSSEKGARYARRVMAIEEKHDHTILPLRSRGTGKPPEKRWIKDIRSEEHTSELQSLTRISYAVIGLTYNNYKTNPIRSSY